MDIKKQFIKLIEEKKDILEVLDLLDTLTRQEKKVLVPIIKKMFDTHNHRDIYNIKALNYAGYYCFTLKEYRSKCYWLYDDFFKDKIAYRFQASWLNNFINLHGHVTYDIVIDYTQQNFITPSNTIIAQSLASWNIQINSLEALLKYKITLKEHIWLLFSNPSTLCYTSNNKWLTIFNLLIQEKKVNRKRVLKETLLTSTHNFDRPLSSWFFTLFDTLKPTQKELLSLQNELFLSLNSPYSKVVNSALKYIKTICTLKGFKYALFIENIPTLLNSDVKLVVNTTLTIIQNIVKPKNSENLCLLTTQALISTDEKIQIKVAKFILKYAQEEKIKEELALYFPTLHISVKELFKGYQIEDEPLHEEIIQNKAPLLRNDNSIEDYENEDELIFFFSQVFKNNEDWHFDIFLEKLTKITSEMLPKLEPAFGEALKCTYYSHEEDIEYFMALTFINLIQTFFKNFPNETKQMQKLLNQMNKEDEVYYHSKEVVYRVKNIDKVKITYKGSIIFIKLLQFAKKRALEKLTIPILSTPTHQPTFIIFSTFINRLKEYQKSKIEFSLFDFQVALARVDLIKNNQENIKEIQGELKDILEYLTNNKMLLDIKKCLTPSWWIVAIYRKDSKEDLKLFLKTFDKNENKIFYLGEEKWKVVEKKEKKYTSHYLTFDNNLEKEDNSILFDAFYHYLYDKENYYYVDYQDNKKLLLLSPHNPSYFFKFYIQKKLYYTNWEDATTTRTTEVFLPILSDIWQKNFKEESYLFLACCFFYMKKPTRELACELWIKAVSQNNIKSDFLGQILGKLEILEYAPLKRFTDLVTQNMLNISLTHNQELEKIVSNMISSMSETKPIRGTKKLVEIYNELLILNKSKVSH